MVSIIWLLEREFSIYSLITPSEFDLLYRWWEKRIPPQIVREGVAALVERREKVGKDRPRIKEMAQVVRKTFAQYQERCIGTHSASAAEVETGREEGLFFDQPPQEIADLVQKYETGLRSSPPDPPTVAAFFQELLSRFERDEELLRRSELFENHLAPQLRSAALIMRYRLNLLISRFSIPDLEWQG